MTSTASPQATGTTANLRDPYIDLLRALSLCIVVLWHWAFTIIVWTPKGPEPTSPLQFAYGLSPLTWLFQVLPLFFFVGGYAHLRVWDKVRANGGGYGIFVLGRARRLVLPTASLITVWLAIYVVVNATWGTPWMFRAVILILSPLWFIGAYLLLVLIAPVMIWLHRRWGVAALVLVGALACAVDIGRFHFGVEWLGYAQLLVVFAFCHQLGFFFDTLAVMPRRVNWAIMLSGLFGLLLLTVDGGYPASMVGVATDKFSNMGPPTFAIIMLTLFQAGAAMLLQPRALRWLKRPRAGVFNAMLNRVSLPLFLFHTTAMSLFILVVVWGLGYVPPSSPTLSWWLQRPLWIAGALVMMVPVLWVFSRKTLWYAFDSMRLLRKDAHQYESSF